MKNKILVLTTCLVLVSMSAFAGGFDDDKIKKKKKPLVVEPATAGGGAQVAKAAPPEVKEVKTETVVTTTPLQRMIRKVSVLIESSPDNCDIEVDGVYIGVTPVQVSLKEGVHHMKIAKAGYLDWSRTVKAYNGLFVSATLVQSSNIKEEITRSAGTE